MDIYARKSRYKLLLLFVAIVIGLGTIFYTNFITKKIAKEEERRAKLWAEAVTSRAKLIKYTNELFNKLSIDERKKVDVWAQSTKFIITVENDEELNFFSNIITSNTDIPVILTDFNGNIVDARNMKISENISGKIIFDTLFSGFRIYPPIAVSYLGRKNFIYYKDSNLFSELKNTLNEIINSFISEVVINTASAPVIMLDDENQLKAFGNIDSTNIDNSQKLDAMIATMKKKHVPILVDLGEGGQRKIYYDDSEILAQLKVYPFIQLLIFAVFALFSYLVMSNARKAEQNQVWVGLAKETAHQLGTPISSMSAWVEYLRQYKRTEVGEEVITELDHDIERLTLVADRFSKIGAQPKLDLCFVKQTIEENIDYIKKRSSKHVIFSMSDISEQLQFLINPQLFGWVLENILKNALDAMDGKGSLNVSISESNQYVIIDLKDSGCGIPNGKHKTIFEPGFSTKRRGWGLGLSLSKRIIEEYHHGKIFVKQSEEGKGTTFRIEIPKA
jgi:nitrogen-specific signal transduction histidine kinase